jgi:hypothetical protein
VKVAIRRLLIACLTGHPTNEAFKKSPSDKKLGEKMKDLVVNEKNEREMRVTEFAGIFMFVSENGEVNTGFLKNRG